MVSTAVVGLGADSWVKFRRLLVQEDLENSTLTVHECELCPLVACRPRP